MPHRRLHRGPALPAVLPPGMRAFGTLPHLPAMAASGPLLPMIAADARSGRIVGGGTLHHLDAVRSIVEIGDWVGVGRSTRRERSS